MNMLWFGEFKYETKIGKLTISDHGVIGRGRNTTVLEGIYDGRSVTIKRCGRSVDNDILLKKQADAMIIYDVHPNIVRYIGKEEDPYFICQSPLKSKLWTIIGTTCNSPEPILYPSALFLQLMRDIVMGLDHLHSKEFVHGNLKPTNILIIEEIMCAKISLDNCLGCQSKEAITNGEQTFADDLYSLGRILLFCISNGKCPFAESLSEHQMQIANKQNILLIDIDIVEARDLITPLLNVKAPSRLNLKQVVNHPLFWDEEKKHLFIRTVSDTLVSEKKVPPGDRCLTNSMETRKGNVFKGSWDLKLDSVVINNIMTGKTRYNFGLLCDLLRFIRNELAHYKEERVGSNPTEVYNYFSCLFPDLLIETYKEFTALAHIAEFKKFYG